MRLILLICRWRCAWRYVRYLSWHSAWYYCAVDGAVRDGVHDYMARARCSAWRSVPGGLTPLATNLGVLVTGERKMVI